MKRSVALSITVVALVACSHLMPVSQAKRADDQAQQDSARQNPPMSSVQDSLLESADSAFDAGQYDKAVALYASIDEPEFTRPQYRFKYAEALRLSGNNREAIRQYDQLTSGDNLDLVLDAKEGKGLALVQEGKFPEAIALFEEVTQQDALRWRTVNALGVVQSLSGHSKAASDYYHMAIAIDKDNPTILSNIGLSLALAGDKQGGMVMLRKALLNLAPNDQRRERIENNLALVYGLMGRMDDAEKILSKYMSQAAVYNNIGFYAKLTNDKKLARTYLSKSLASSPVYYDKAAHNLKNL